MLKSNLCDHSDTYKVVKGTITRPATADAGTRRLDERSKGLI